MFSFAQDDVYKLHLKISNMASYDSHISLTRKIPKACHVASNQIFFSHNFFFLFWDIFTGQMFNESDDL